MKYIQLLNDSDYVNLIERIIYNFTFSVYAFVIYEFKLLKFVNLNLISNIFRPSLN